MAWSDGFWTRHSRNTFHTRLPFSHTRVFKRSCTPFHSTSSKSRSSSSMSSTVSVTWPYYRLLALNIWLRKSEAEHLNFTVLQPAHFLTSCWAFKCLRQLYRNVYLARSGLQGAEANPSMLLARGRGYPWQVASWSPVYHKANTFTHTYIHRVDDIL